MDFTPGFFKVLKAIEKARPNFKPITKDLKGYNYKYADLAKVYDSILNALEAQGLYVHHFVSTRDEYDFLVTIVYDIVTEDYVKSEINLNGLIEPQKKGAAITYYRRYNLLCLLNLVPEDDDGIVKEKKPPVIEKRETRLSRAEKEALETASLEFVRQAPATKPYIDSIMEEASKKGLNKQNVNKLSLLKTKKQMEKLTRDEALRLFRYIKDAPKTQLQKEI